MEDDTEFHHDVSDYFDSGFDGWNPLHHACFHDNLDEVKLLVDAGVEGHDYNAETPAGRSPIFYTYSSGIVEELLKFDDLEVRAKDGLPLLIWCAERGIVTERIASDRKLRGQLGERWDGSLPLEHTLRIDVNSSIAIVKGLEGTPLEVRTMNMRVLLVN